MKITKNKIIWTLIIAIALFLIYRAVRKSILENRIKKAIDNKEGDYGTSKDLASDKALDPNLYKKSNPSLSDAEANSLAKQVYDAHGFFNDDEDSVYAAFQKCPAKVDVSKMSAFFLTKYSQDIYSYIENFMNEEELQKVQTIIKSKL